MSKKALLLAQVAASILLFTGCASQVPTTDGGGTDAAFSGPWAAEFRDAYERSSTDFERTILSDSVVSEQEYAEMRAHLRSCLTEKGFSEVEFSDDGGMNFTTPDSMSSDEMQKRTELCSVESGESTVGALYTWIRRNPENLDEARLQVDCLIRKEAVEPSYTPEDFEKDSPEMSIPFTSGKGESALRECAADPLGLFE